MRVDEIINEMLSSTHPTLHLKAPLLGQAMPLSKDVDVSFGRGVDPMHFDAPWRVHWETSEGAFPAFDGTLCVCADETYASSIIELRGEYTPPLGLAGEVFDHAVGSRIASATARNLLEGIARKIEARYGEIERSKHVTSN